MNGEPRPASWIKPRPIRWTWRNILPAGMLTVVAGVPGSSKSLLAAAISADVAGTGDVIISNPEDPVEEVTVPRLIAAGADLDRIHVWEFDADNIVDVDYLGHTVEALGVKLVVLDPLAAHTSSTRRAILPIAKMAHRTGCAVLGIHHTTKGGTATGSPIDQVAGPTGGAIGTARALYVFGRHPGNPGERVLANLKIVEGEAPLPLSFQIQEREVDVGDEIAMVATLVICDEAPDVTAREILYADSDEPLTYEGLASVAEWLTLELKRPKPVQRVIERGWDFGLSRGTVMRAARHLGLVEEGGLWRLPIRHPLANL